MKKIIAAMALAFGLAGTAHAQYMGTMPPNADTRIFYSQDSDNFKVLHTWVGAAHESGFGARVGYSRYEGTQEFRSVNGYYGYYSSADESVNRFGVDPYVSNNKFTADGAVFQLTYVNVGENHDFHGAIGVRKTDYRTDTKNAENANVKVEQTAASLANQYAKNGNEVWSGTWTPDGVQTLTSSDVNGSRDTLVADAELKLIMTDRFTIGAAVATDLVESARSIQTGTRYVYTAADADYLLTENLNFNVIAGNMYFTDNNNRPFIRTKTTWTFLPEHGVSTYLRTRNQYDTNPGSYNYFSPDTLAQQAIGLAIRKPYSGLVYTAGVEFGSEQVTVDGNKDTHPIYGWQLGVQTSPGRKTGTTFGASLVGSNASGFNGGGSDYNWYGATLWIKVPL